MATDAGRATVALFTRAAVQGTVKTRLAREVGDAVALDVHRELLDRAVAALRDRGDFDLVLYVDGDASTLAAYGVPTRPQVTGDLGRRMAAAVAELTALRPGAVKSRVAVIVGADCPLLGAPHVCEAVAAVDAGADVALVPAEDGGYVLIAMARLHASLFTDIPWGTSEVLAATRRAASQAGLVLRELAPSWDVDDARDLARYRALKSGSPSVRSSG